MNQINVLGFFDLKKKKTETALEKLLPYYTSSIFTSQNCDEAQDCFQFYDAH